MLARKKSEAKPNTAITRAPAAHAASYPFSFVTSKNRLGVGLCIAVPDQSAHPRNVFWRNEGAYLDPMKAGRDQRLDEGDAGLHANGRFLALESVAWSHFDDAYLTPS